MSGIVIRFRMDFSDICKSFSNKDLSIQENIDMFRNERTRQQVTALCMRCFHEDKDTIIWGSNVSDSLRD